MKRNFVTLTLLAFLLCASMAANVYGHGLGKDQASPPIIVGEKQVTVEGSISPAVVPFPENSRPTLMVRTLHLESNATISGVDYRITVALRNATLIDQRFRSADGVVLANLIPDKNVEGWLITGHESAKPEDQIEASAANPLELRSGILATGGLYHIAVIIENGSPGIGVEEDKKFDLYISVSQSFDFKADTEQGEQNIVIKTYYDDVSDFSYENRTISFSSPFNWDPDYIRQVPVLHMEVQFPKSLKELQNNSYAGSLNGVELRADSIQIDDYTSESDRLVHFIISSARLERIAESVKGSNIAEFELKAIEKPSFPLDLLSAPSGKYLFQLAWGPDLIETGVPITFVMNLKDPATGELSRQSNFDFALLQDGREIHRQRLASGIGVFSHEFTFSRQGTVTLLASNINGGGESVEIDLVVLLGSNPAPSPSPPSGCLIATAAFGSELAPQVQYLRNFREQQILSTMSGSAFMSTFNSLYYSFSPQVADYEREQPWLQETLRVMLYPLFGILTASERAHSLAGGEAGAILAGATASSLIGVTYLLPLGIAARNRISGRILAIIIGIVVTFLAATLTYVPSMLPLSTAILVVAFAFASATMMVKIGVRLRMMNMIRNTR